MSVAVSPASPARELRLHAGKRGWAEAQIAKYPPGRQASAVIPLLWRAQEQDGCWVPQAGDRDGRRACSAWPTSACSRSRPSTRCSTWSRSGSIIIQMCGTTPCMLRGPDEIKAVLERRIGPQRQVTADGTVLLARSRVPRRLLQRADGADQRRLLRGSDRREFREVARRSRRRPAGKLGLADRPRDVGAGRRPDHADRALWRRRAQRSGQPEWRHTAARAAEPERIRRDRRRRTRSTCPTTAPRASRAILDPVGRTSVRGRRREKRPTIALTMPRKWRARRARRPDKARGSTARRSHRAGARRPSRRRKHPAARCDATAGVPQGRARARQAREDRQIMLADKDRIFTNLYGLGDWGLEGARDARRLGQHQGAHRQRPRLDHQRDEGLGPARARRRGLPDRPQMVLHAEAAIRRGRTISSSMPTSPSPAPARTARSCATIRIS